MGSTYSPLASSPQHWQSSKAQGESQQPPLPAPNVPNLQIPGGDRGDEEEGSQTEK